MHLLQASKTKENFQAMDGRRYPIFHVFVAAVGMVVWEKVREWLVDMSILGVLLCAVELWDWVSS